MTSQPNGFPFAYTPDGDMIHKSSCPALLLQPSEPTERQHAFLRITVGTATCPVCMPATTGSLPRDETT